MVKSVVGFNALRGDLISVEALIETPKTSPIEHVKPIRTSPANANGWTLMIGLLTILLIALSVRQRVRIKQRRALLNELSQWLIEHE